MSTITPKRQPHRQRKQTAIPKPGAITSGLVLHLIIAELSPRTAAVGLRFDGDNFATFFTGDLSAEIAAHVAQQVKDGGIDTLVLLSSSWRRVQLGDRRTWRSYES